MEHQDILIPLLFIVVAGCSGNNDNNQATEVPDSGQSSDVALADAGSPDGGSVDHDPDGDGLDEIAEAAAGTNPAFADTDADGLSDGLELLGPDGQPNSGDEVGTDPLVDDTDGDGLEDGEEDLNRNGVIDAGETDPTKADSDGDGWSDGDELACGSAPLDAAQTAGDFDQDMICDLLDLDDDNDGVTDEQEILDGTDPLSTDTDGDGFLDEVERTAMTSSTDPYSWPYESGIWPDFSDEAAADTVAGTTFGLGEVFPNFTFEDQFGNAVDLYDFYGHVMMVNVIAGWCQPCRLLSQVNSELWTQHRSRGFITIDLLIEGADPNSPAAGFQSMWAMDESVAYPVVARPTDTFTIDISNAGIFTRNLPTSFMIGRDMTLRETKVGTSTVPQYEEVLLPLLQE